MLSIGASDLNEIMSLKDDVDGIDEHHGNVSSFITNLHDSKAIHAFVSGVYQTNRYSDDGVMVDPRGARGITSGIAQ